MDGVRIRVRVFHFFEGQGSLRENEEIGEGRVSEKGGLEHMR